MSDLFQKNLEALSRTNPASGDRIAHADSSAIVKVPTKNGDFVPQMDRDGKKILLHSKFDPKTEAERFL
jgi:hypothetical protein